MSSGYLSRTQHRLCTLSQMRRREYSGSSLLPVVCIRDHWAGGAACCARLTAVARHKRKIRSTVISHLPFPSLLRPLFWRVAVPMPSVRGAEVDLDLDADLR